MPNNHNLTLDGLGVNLIRFSWWSGTKLQPLWDAGKVTTNDEQWLRLVVGLSDTSIARVRAWTVARDALGARPSPEQVTALDAQADALVAGLNTELDSRFTVTHVH